MRATKNSFFLFLEEVYASECLDNLALKEMIGLLIYYDLVAWITCSQICIIWRSSKPK